MLSSEDIGLFATGHKSILVRVVGTAGSAPRQTDAFMLVARDQTLGTIGGGQLEYLMMDRARQMLRDGEEHNSVRESVSLGPDIGQCCGGRVNVTLEACEGSVLTDLLADIETEETSRPKVYLFGGGHVGLALARVFATLPVHVHLIETRRDAPAMLEDLPSVSKRLTALPEDVVAGAEPGSAFVVLTHDHALDFLIASACLKRKDAAYVGMIGSKTKRASFDSWSRREGHGFSAELICPMAPDAMTDKRPEVLAVNFASEIMQAFSRKNQEEWSEHVDQAAN